MTKILYLDTETTGLDPVRNDPYQIAGIIEIDGKVEEEFNLFCQPLDWSTIDDHALAMNGKMREDLEKYPLAKTVRSNLIKILDKYVDRFNRHDKFTPAGQNVTFDLQFLNHWFKKLHDDYWGSWCTWYPLDLRQLVTIAQVKGWLRLENQKLATVAAAFGIDFQAHDAMEDVRVTHKIISRMMESLTTKNLIEEKHHE